ncbi:probable G-protein coupled receptor 139 [Littorina saxatilis]|uniref:G-protein coupled receptors family 1 profile domain-containing protein n=1 Tax=Littorina saxatilis TaxID=31220 RepID=A0AAN9C344_9CAEN
MTTTNLTFTPSTLPQTSTPWNATDNTTLPSYPHAPPPPSLTDILRMYPDYRIAQDLGLYGCSVQIAVGTITNLLTIAVMTRRTMMASTTCFYFALLAVGDLMVLYFASLRRLLYVANDHTDIYMKTEIACRVMDFLTYLSYDLCSWILTAMTVDRFVAIRYPLKAAIVCTIRNAIIAIVIITLACIAKNLHFIFTFERTEGETCLPRDRHIDFYDDVWPWIDAAFYSFIPFSLLIFFNCIIIHCHRVALKRKRSLHACGSVTTATQGSRLAGFNQRLTAMLLVVSFTFMAMTAPKVILIIIREDYFEFFPPEGGINIEVVARYSLVSAVFNFLMWTNHTINFFLYCLSGKRFRQELLRMIVQCLHRKRNTQVFISRQRQGQGGTIPRRGSNSSVVSDDVAPAPAQLPTETEDALSRVNRWATVTFGDRSAANRN